MDEELDTPGKRLRFARERAGFPTAQSAAKKARINPVSWRAYENDQHGFTKHVTKIARIVNADVEWLIEGGQLFEADTFAASAAVDQPGNEIEMVPRLDISYAMGDGTLLDEHHAAEFLPFSYTFLRQFARGSTDQLFIATGHGESMEPTLRRDDLVMIDTSQTRVAFQDHLWALTYCGAGMIKRLRRIAGGHMLILSDNPAVPPQEAMEDDIHVVGKVVWIARMM